MPTHSEPARQRYTITADAPNTHRVSIRLELDGFGPSDSSDVVLRMASWCPGSYLVRDYARFVRDVAVTDGAGNPVEVSKTAKNNWAVKRNGAASLVVSYRVYGYDLSVRTNHIDATHAFLHAPATFLFVAGRESEALDVAVDLPSSREWKVVTGLSEGEGKRKFRAADLDELLDCPLHLGITENRTFRAADCEFELAVWGPVAAGSRTLDDLTADLAPIIETHARRFGGLPFKKYTFILMLAPKAYGGLEHKNSSANLASSFAFSKDNSYTELLELLSHEFFHVWNGKRIFPEAFAPFDYDSENYTAGLWVMEGLTSFYDRYTVLRAGKLGLARYFEKLADEWGRMLTTPGRLHHSVEAASFDAWIKLYKPDASNINSTISYYLKGGLVATTLDLWIRRQSGGERSLDDVLLALWKTFGETGRGYPEDVQAIFEEATGLAMDEPFNRWIRGTEDPDLVAELSHLGIDLTESSKKKAGFLGTRCSDGPLRVLSVLEGTPAMLVGLAPAYHPHRRSELQLLPVLFRRILAWWIIRVDVLHNI